MLQFTKHIKWHVRHIPQLSVSRLKKKVLRVTEVVERVSQQDRRERTPLFISSMSWIWGHKARFSGKKFKRNGPHWLAKPFFQSSGPINSSRKPYPWKWGSLCCQGCPSVVQSWGLICGQLCILGDSGTGAAVAVVVAEVVCRYQKGQWKRHEHLYNKAIIWGLNISHSEKIPLLFLLMTVPTKVLQTAKINNCNFLHMFYQLCKGLIQSATELLFY